MNKPLIYGGGMICVSDGADLLGMRSRGARPPVASLRLSADGGLSIAGRKAGRDGRVTSTLERGDMLAATVRDLKSTDPDALYRSVESTETLTFAVEPGDGAYLCDPVPASLSGADFVILRIFRGGDLLFIALTGDVCAGRDRITVGPGSAGMLFAAASDPDEAERRISQCASLIRRGAFKSGIGAGTDGSDYAMSVILNQRDGGAVIRDLSDPRADAFTQYLCVRALCGAGRGNEAAKTVGAYLGAYRKYGYLPADLLRPDRDFPSDDAVVPPLLTLCALELPPEYLDGGIHDMMIGSMAKTAALTRSGAVPFGIAPRDSQGILFPDRGSAENTAFFILAGRRLLEYAADRLIKVPAALEKAVNEAEAAFHSHFTSQGVPLCCTDGSGADKKPKYRRGLCRLCSESGDRVSPVWTVRTERGYMCPACADAFLSGRIAASKLPDSPEPSYPYVVRAAFAGSRLYPTGVVRQAARVALTNPGTVTDRSDFGILSRVISDCGMEDKYRFAALGLLDGSEFGMKDPAAKTKFGIPERPDPESDPPLPDAACCAAYLLASTKKR